MSARRWAATAFVVGVAVTGWAAPAAAHATLEATTPAADSVTADPPAAVVLRFSEPVDPGLGGVKVVAPSGERVDRGTTERGEGGREVRAPIDAVSEGSYTVAWSVVSSDGHLLSGSFVFSVGRETAVVAADGDGRALLRAAAAGARWAAFAGTLVLVGPLVFDMVVAGPAGLELQRRRRIRRVAAAGAVAAAVAAAGVLVAQVALASGRTVLAAVGLVGDAVTSARFATLGAARVGLAVAALVAAGAWAARPGRASRAAVLAPAAGLVVVPALAGHAWTTAPRFLAVAVDAVHFAAVGVWVGGLVALLVTAPGSRASSGAARRFSALAAAALAVVVVTGAVSGYLQVRSLDALTGTAYGRLLAVKVTVVAAVVALGWVNRQRLVRLLPARTTLFRVVQAEVALAAIVLAVTAGLVNRPPAREALVRPFAGSVTLAGQPADGSVQVQVQPARPGRNDVHLYFLDGRGLPRPVDAVEVAVGREGVPPRRVAVTPVTPDHASAYGVNFPSPGVWQLTVTTVREGQASTVTMEVPIR